MALTHEVKPERELNYNRIFWLEVEFGMEPSIGREQLTDRSAKDMYDSIEMRQYFQERRALLDLDDPYDLAKYQQLLYLRERGLI